MNTTKTFELLTDNGEINLTVGGTFYPFIRGSRDKWGAPEEPDEPAHWMVESIKIDNVEIEDWDEFCESIGMTWDRLEEICEEKLEEERNSY